MGLIGRRVASFPPAEPKQSKLIAKSSEAIDWMGLPDDRIYVDAGQVHCSVDALEMSTVLGSCVAVCLWDPRLGAGGMNHYALPTAPHALAGARYGDASIDLLLHGMNGLGCRTADLRAKIFGGANVLPTSNDRGIGDNNVALALKTLSAHRIPVIARRTGGRNGMYVRFLSGTGKVLVKQINRLQ